MRGVTMEMIRFLRSASLLMLLSMLLSGAALAQEEQPEPDECFESREGYTTIMREDIRPGWPNVNCSKRTGGVLWWGDPFFDTGAMGPLSVEADYSHEEAVVRPRVWLSLTVDQEMAQEVTDETDRKILSLAAAKVPVGIDSYAGLTEKIAGETGLSAAKVGARLKALEEEGIVMREYESKLNYYMPCTMCHNGTDVPVPPDTNSRKPTDAFPHVDVPGLENILEDPMSIKHGRGAIWCLDCHDRTNRDVLRDHRGNAISFNQPMKLCGKCHGQIYRDWREGIHGKRIGMWTKGGKKRWWTCTECHNPHDIQQGARNSGFAQLQPEPAPELPKGMKNADGMKYFTACLILPLSYVMMYSSITIGISDPADFANTPNAHAA